MRVPITALALLLLAGCNMPSDDEGEAPPGDLSVDTTEAGTDSGQVQTAADREAEE